VKFALPKMALAPTSAAGVGLLLAGVAEVPNFYSGMLPSLWTIGHFAGEGGQDAQEAQFWIKRGLIISGALTGATGFGISLLAGSWAPMIGMTAMGVVLTYFYLHALRSGGGASW
jgi:hypothetical protein